MSVESEGQESNSSEFTSKKAKNKGDFSTMYALGQTKRFDQIQSKFIFEKSIREEELQLRRQELEIRKAEVQNAKDAKMQEIVMQQDAERQKRRTDAIKEMISKEMDVEKMKTYLKFFDENQ